MENKLADKYQKYYEKNAKLKNLYQDVVDKMGEIITLESNLYEKPIRPHSWQVFKCVKYYVGKKEPPYISLQAIRQGFGIGLMHLN